MNEKVGFYCKSKKKVELKSDWVFKWSRKKKEEVQSKYYPEVNLILGGSGVTPAVQILKRLEVSGVSIKIIYANRTEESMMLKKTIQQLVSSTKANILYLFSQDPNHQSLYLDQLILSQFLHPPSPACLNLFCGPKPMNKLINKTLQSIGH